MRRFWFVLLGNIIIGLGISVLRLSGFGTDPYTAMNLGISSHIPLSFGTWQVLCNALLFIPCVIVYPRAFGIGALINMIGLGYMIDFCMLVWSHLGMTPEGLAGILSMRILLLLGGLLICSFGCSLYLEADMGAASYDLIGLVVEKLSHGKWKYKYIRMIQDAITTTIGFLLGATIGVATLTFVLGFGPLISFFREHAAHRLVYGKQ